MHECDAFASKQPDEAPRDRGRGGAYKRPHRQLQNPDAGPPQVVAAHARGVETDDRRREPTIERHRDFRQLPFRPAQTERAREQHNRPGRRGFHESIGIAASDHEPFTATFTIR